MELLKKKLNHKKPVFDLNGLLPCMLTGRKRCAKCEVCTELVTEPFVDDADEPDLEQENNQHVKN